ncbi:urease accessory protein UreD [Paenibacillus ginsengihumi]|uniref:urease accessory protein UreD n=1 Tax=Paenibacillus ginsengihumi TaxID=431596 RepID=UPI00047565A3|nr:urease accessory protein UreD [Paenibacillus ginsengihumi]
MPRVTGSVRAEFSASGGATRLERSVHSYPLKIAKTFSFPNRQLGVYVMDASPGMMAGDRYELSWHFGEAANVFVTNQSYTKVHPSVPGAGGASEQRQKLVLEQGAYVEYMPEPVTLYKDARFRSATDVVLAPGAALVMSDIVCPGRLHRGELFQYEQYRSRLTVWLEEEPIYQSRQRLEPAASEVEAAGRFEDYTHLASFYVFSDRIGPDTTGMLRGALELFMEAGAPVYCGVSSAVKHGVIVSALGRRVIDLERVVETAWTAVRRELFGQPPLKVPK